MRNVLFLAFLAFSVFSSCRDGAEKQQGSEEETETVTQVDSVDLADAPVMQFDVDTYDFNKIKEGEKVNYVFTFTNTGKSPLIINDVQAGCGCTTPTFDKKPIKPGEQGKIEVGFNSAGQRGPQHKIVTIYSNANPAQSAVHLKGEVLSE